MEVLISKVFFVLIMAILQVQVHSVPLQSDNDDEIRLEEGFVDTLTRQQSQSQGAAGGFATFFNGFIAGLTAALQGGITGASNLLDGFGNAANNTLNGLLTGYNSTAQGLVQGATQFIGGQNNSRS